MNIQLKLLTAYSITFGLRFFPSEQSEGRENEIGKHKSRDIDVKKSVKRNKRYIIQKMITIHIRENMRVVGMRIW